MLLGLDLGTTNVKALVTDWGGKPLSRGACPVQLFRSADGAVEQDIAEIWEATLTAIRQAVSSVSAEAIRAIGVSSQGGAMQVLDQHGEALGRVISWLDQRGVPFDEELGRELGKPWFLERIAHGGSWLAIGQILRLRRQQTGLAESPSRVSFVGDIIVSRLCGEFAHDGTSAGLTLLYNPFKRTYDPDVLARLGLVPRQLPRLLSPRSAAGELLPTIAAQTGLKAGIAVSPAIHDQYASALGTGATRPGTVMVGTGTAWVLLHVTSAAPAPATDEAFVCHHVLPDSWGQILSMVNGGSSLSWVLELTGKSRATNGMIDELLSAAPAGSDGIRFWPFLTPFGASGLAPGTRGRLAGIQLHHSVPFFIRAVVEGLGYELNRYLGLLRAKGQQVEGLAMGGGAAASSITPQVLADISGLPLHCLTGSDATTLGAAILARGLLEPQACLATIAKEMRPPARVVTPGPNAPFYQQEFRRYLDSLPLATRRSQASSLP